MLSKHTVGRCGRSVADTVEPPFTCGLTTKHQVGCGLREGAVKVSDCANCVKVSKTDFFVKKCDRVFLKARIEISHKEKKNTCLPLCSDSKFE